MAKKVIQVVYQVNNKDLITTKKELDGIEKEAKQADDAVKKFGVDAQKAGNQAAGSFNNLNNITKAIGWAAIGTAVVGLSKKILDLGIKQEQLNISFEVFLGSAEKAKVLLSQLNKFALVTPFTPDQVNKAAQSLLAFGVKGEEIIPTLKMLGDVSSGTGKDLSEMAIIFGQIRSTGRLMGQDLLQLINAGFNPLQVISEKTGQSVGKLKKDMEAGLITFDMVSDAFKSATSEGGLFFNLMEKQSQSVGGLLSTVSGNIDEILKNIFSASSGPVKAFTQQLVELSENFLRLSETGEQTADRLRTENIASIIEGFQAFAKAYDNINEAAEVNNKLLAEEEKRLKARNDAIYDGAKATDGEYAANFKRIDQIKLEIEEIKKYTDTINAKELTDAEAAKIKRLEAEAIATEKLLKLKLKKHEVDVVERAEAEESGINSIDALFGDSLGADTKAVAERLFGNYEENLRVANEQQEVLDENNKEIEQKQKDHQRNIDNIRKQSFDYGINLLHRFLSGSEEMTEKQKKETRRQILIDGALNAVKALGLPPIPGANFPAAATALGQAFFMAGLVGSFKDGVIDLQGPGTGTSDSINARLSKGESVITADATSNSMNLLKAINDRKIDDRILSNLRVTSSGIMANLNDERIVRAIEKNSANGLSRDGYTLMETQKMNDSFKRRIRSKIIN
jgi:tape measure domain-containing protein